MRVFKKIENKKSATLKVIVCVSLAFALLLLGGCFASGGKTQKVQQGMAAYLHDRYGIEFDVGKPYVTGSMSTAHYQAKVHPKEQPEIEFLVNDQSSLEDAGSGKYADYYLEAKWSYQGKQEVEKKLRKVYGEGADFRVVSYEFGGGSYVLKDLDYVQVFEKTHAEGNINIDYDIYMESTQFNKEIEAQKAYHIFKSFILDYGTSRYYFSVTYIDKSFKQDYLENSKPYIDKWRVLHRGVHFSDKYEKEIEDKNLLGRISIGPKPSETIVINRENDLVKYY